jgi:hypothetical protein
MKEIGAIRRLKELAAVPLSVVRPYLAGWDKTRYAAIFKKYGVGKKTDKYRIYIPITEAKAKPETVKIPEEIESYLTSKGMRIDNYKLGTAYLPDGKRITKIGKILSDNAALKKVFDNDPQRTLSKAVPAWVVISRHPYDIVGMSFDRGWTSCMHATEGGFKKFLPREVAIGTLVAYLISAKDAKINNPIARIAIKVYENGKAKSRILIPSKVYGTSSPAFRNIVNRFCVFMNSGSPRGVYRLAPGSYDDLNLVSVLHGYSSDIRDLSPEKKVKLVGNPLTPEGVLQIAAQDKSYAVRYALACNINAPPDVLERLATDKDSMIRIAVARNDNVPFALLEKLAKDTSYEVRGAVGGSAKVSGATLLTLARDRNPDVRYAVAENPRSSPQVLGILLWDKHAYIRRAVALNPNCPESILSWLVSDPKSEVRFAVIKNPNITPDLLRGMLNDFNSTVRQEANKRLSTLTPLN